MSASTRDVRDTAFLFQRLFVVIERYNSVLIYESFGDLDLEPSSHSFYLFFTLYGINNNNNNNNNKQIHQNNKQLLPRHYNKS